MLLFFFFFQAEDGIRDLYVTGVQTCALPISPAEAAATRRPRAIRPRARTTRQRLRVTPPRGGGPTAVGPPPHRLHRSPPARPAGWCCKTSRRVRASASRGNRRAAPSSI